MGEEKEEVEGGREGGKKRRENDSNCEGRRKGEGRRGNYI